MSRIYRVLLLMLLISLVIMGLNTSNKGIARLTAEDRGQVIGVNFQDKDFKLQAFSKDYVYSRDKLLAEETDITAKIRIMGKQSKEYLLRIWKIFIAII